MMKERVRRGALCMLAAALLLLFCSQCSPLYPLNIWDDANCLLTVGRVMRAGGVLYRDIYEQKGPTLYLIHALAACLSDSGFGGVYVMEALSLAAALCSACCLLRRHLSESLSLAGAVLLGACMLVSSAFSRGDSAEEFCLPLLLGAMALTLDAYDRDEGPMRPGRLFACGLLAGGVATIKYTMLGLFIGLCLAEGLTALRHGGLKRALLSAGAFLSGMLLPVLLWAAYFAAKGALRDAYEAYIYNNIFLYDGARADSGIGTALRDLLLYLRANLLWVLPAAGGMLALLLDRRMSRQARLAAALMALCQLVAVCFLGRVWPYCPLALSVFAVLGLRALLLHLPQKIGRRGGAVLAGASALALGLAVFASPNAYLRGVRLENTAQGRLCAYIEPGATLLQYKHLDDGFYLVSGTLPQERFFVRLNVALDEMVMELDRYLEEALPDYVVTSWTPLPERFDRYQLIATDAGYDERDRINKMFYLYRRRG